MGLFGNNEQQIRIDAALKLANKLSDTSNGFVDTLDKIEALQNEHYKLIVEIGEFTQGVLKKDDNSSKEHPKFILDGNDVGTLLYLLDGSNKTHASIQALYKSFNEGLNSLVERTKDALAELKKARGN